MKKVAKIVMIVVVMLMVIYGIMYYSDYKNVSNFKLPIGIDADSFYGDEVYISRIGYKIKFYENDGNIVKMQIVWGEKVVAESTGVLENNSAEMKNEILNMIDDNNEVISNNQNTEINPNDYIGTWGAERCSIEISKVSNNTFDVLIHWGSSAFEYEQWKYTCNFNEENGHLICSDSGVREKVTLTDEEGASEKVTKEYSDGKAEFYIKDGYLIWNDKKENAGEDMKFEKAIQFENN